ncbi:MAG: PEP-CTERM sorting domain-containing protein [Phycisphaerales bacterium JB065]
MKLVAIGAMLSSCAVAGADIAIQFNDFSNTKELVINGAAEVVESADGAVMRLTPAAGGRAGSIFSETLIEASNFSTRFSFRITENGGAIFDGNISNGADGIVFVIQPVDSSLGSLGQGIGYSGIQNSLGIEFDTWGNNGNNDPSQSHVGIDINGSVNHNSGLPTANISNPELDEFGDRWWAWVEYDGTTLEVRLSLEDSRPTEPLLSTEIDLVDILGQTTAYIGFTSATGAAWANHDIIDWAYGGFCAGDVNEDGFVDLADLNIVLANFGTDNIAGDANGDGFTNLADLNIVLAFFGDECV